MADRGRPKNLTTLLRGWVKSDGTLKSSDTTYLLRLADELETSEMRTTEDLIEFLQDRRILQSGS